MISCNEYDYIEIVCLFNYAVKLSMKSGQTIEGIAIDTQRNDKHEECIKISVNGAEELVVLDELSGLDVCVENPHFESVTFE